MDIGRTCFTRRIRPWVGDDTEVLVRYYRGRPGAPCIAIPHIFGQNEMWDEQPPRDLNPGEPGEMGPPRTYDKGRTLPAYDPDGSFVGSPRQWLDGSVRGIDPVLTQTRSGFSLECLAQQGRALRWRRWGRILDGITG